MPFGLYTTCSNTYIHIYRGGTEGREGEVKEEEEEEKEEKDEEEEGGGGEIKYKQQRTKSKESGNQYSPGKYLCS